MTGLKPEPRASSTLRLSSIRKGTFLTEYAQAALSRESAEILMCIAMQHLIPPTPLWRRGTICAGMAAIGSQLSAAMAAAGRSLRSLSPKFLSAATLCALGASNEL